MKLWQQLQVERWVQVHRQGLEPLESEADPGPPRVPDVAGTAVHAERRLERVRGAEDQRVRARAGLVEDHQRTVLADLDQPTAVLDRDQRVLGTVHDQHGP